MLDSSRSIIRSWKLSRLLALAFACLALAGARPAQAQVAPPDSPPAAPAAPPTIGRIIISGNAFTDSTRILRTFEVRPGQPFSADAVRRGQHKLGALGLFSNWKVDRVDHPEANTVDLIITVTERPRIAKLSFEGMKRKTRVDA